MFVLIIYVLNGVLKFEIIEIFTISMQIILQFDVHSSYKVCLDDVSFGTTIDVANGFY